MICKCSLCFNAAFILLCSSLFVYQAYHSFINFIHQDPITYTVMEDQELHPLPSICIRPLTIPRGKYTRHNISHHGYNWEGKWRSFLPNYDEKQTYDDLSSSLQDLLHTVTLRKESNAVSDNYFIETISITNNSLPISRCDYFKFLKCYCINLSDMENAFGIQDLFLKTAQNAKISIVPKNQFFGYHRKLTQIYTPIGYDYTYIIDHSISKQLPTEPNGCSQEIDWKSDICFLRYTHNKIFSRLNCTTPWLLIHSR